MTVNEWFAPGVGLVKLDSPNMKRELTGYSVSTGTSPQLTVALMGSGGGSVNSDPAGFICNSGACTQPYPAGASVSLTATPDGDSQFASWGGDCTGSDPCTLSTSADHTVTATFTEVSPARIGTTGYGSLQEACNAVSGNTTIAARTRTFTEELTIDKPWLITIKGGYDKDFVNRTGITTLDGKLTIAEGGLVADLVQIN